MRIFDRGVTGTGAAETGRTVQSQPSGRGSGSPPAASGADGDQVQLSGTLQRLSQVLGKDGAERSAKVQSLAAQYRSGTYQVDSLAVSRGLVSEALSGAGRG